MTKHVSVALILLQAVFSTPVAAQEAGTEEKERLNAVELFLGGLTETEADATGFGIGVEYNRRLTRHWSIGVEMIEISTTDEGRSWLVVFPVYYHPIESLNLKAGPGIEGSKEEPEGKAESESKTEFAVRFGVGWEFELGPRFTISPEINLDLIGDKVTWVYGLSFGLRL